MRRFQFRLERFLDLKRYRERGRELALARVLGQWLLLKRRIAEIDAEVDAWRGRAFPMEARGSAAYETPAGREIDIQALAARELYILRLSREKDGTERALAEKTVELEQARAEYLEAAKERKVLDKLKERKELDYYKKQKDEEFKIIDEVNTAAQLRQRW
jgi:flagellar FliJ protein